MPIARVLASVALLTACSPYAYKSEIGEFSNGVNGLGTAVTQANTSTLADQQRAIGFRYQGDLAAQRIGLAVAPSCAPEIAPDQTPCELLTGPSRAPVQVDSAMQAIFNRDQKIVQFLQTYSGALTAITNADDRKTLDAATTSLCTTVSTIATTVSAVAGPIVGAACGVIGQAAGLFFDQRRYNTLKISVVEVDARIMPGLSHSLFTDLNALEQARLTSLSTVVNNQLAEVKALARGRLGRMLPDLTCRMVSGYAQKPSVRPQLFELWGSKSNRPLTRVAPTSMRAATILEEARCAITTIDNCINCSGCSHTVFDDNTRCVGRDVIARQAFVLE